MLILANVYKPVKIETKEHERIIEDKKKEEEKKIVTELNSL